MRTILRRIEKLEVLRSEAAEDGMHVLVLQAGMQLALGGRRCVEILRQAGFLRSGSVVLRLLDVPWGLDATALEGYLRSHGAEICGSGSTVAGRNSYR
jgi:hypothetical protein